MPVTSMIDDGTAAGVGLASKQTVTSSSSMALDRVAVLRGRLPGQVGAETASGPVWLSRSMARSAGTWTATVPWVSPRSQSRTSAATSRRRLSRAEVTSLLAPGDARR